MTGEGTIELINVINKKRIKKHPKIEISLVITRQNDYFYFCPLLGKLRTSTSVFAGCHISVRLGHPLQYLSKRRVVRDEFSHPAGEDT